MRIKGPSDGPRSVDEAGAVDEADAVDGVDETAGAQDAKPVAKVGGTGGAGGVDPIGQVAARLRAGEISSEEAVELLIDDAVTRQLTNAAGNALVPEGKRDELRQILRSYAANDPYLAARIRRLSQGK
jgi:hypothetical protein